MRKQIWRNLGDPFMAIQIQRLYHDIIKEVHGKQQQQVWDILEVLLCSFNTAFYSIHTLQIVHANCWRTLKSFEI